MCPLVLGSPGSIDLYIVSSCSCLWSSPFAATRGVFDEGWSLDLPVGRKVTFDCSEELAGLAKWR